MKFVVDTRRRAGKLTQRATVTTNDAKHHQETLACSTSVLVPFKMESTEKTGVRSVRFGYISFGQIDRKTEAVHKTFKITRGDGGPLALELPPIANPNIEASLREIEPGESYELDVGLKPPWPNGRSVRGQLALKTGIEERPQEAIDVSAVMLERLRVSPTRFFIPQDLTAERDLRVRLLWSGGEPAKILEATTTDSRTSVRIEEQNKQQSVVLKVPAGYAPEAKTKPAVVVKTDDPEKPTLRIPIYSRPVPRVRVSPPRFSIPQNVTSELNLRAQLVWSRGEAGKILELTPGDPKITVRLEEQNERQYVVLTVPKGYQPQRSTYITIKTDDRSAPTLRIPVYRSRIVARLRAVPNRFNVPPEVQSELELKARLIWTGGSAGKTLEATTSDPQTSVRLEQHENIQYVVLHIPAGYTAPAETRAFVTVKTSDPTMPALRIPIYPAATSRLSQPPPPPARRASSEVKRPVPGTKPQPPPKPEP